MRSRDIIRSVKNRGHFESQEQVREAIEATLEVLGRRLMASDAKAIAEHLPPALAEHLDQTNVIEFFDLESFQRRVSHREGVSLEEAADHTRAVLGMLSEVVDKDELQRLRKRLPQEFTPLLRAS